MTAYDHTNDTRGKGRTTDSRRGGGQRPRGARGQAPTSLQVLESTFRLVTTGPDPLMVDGAAIGQGLPRRRIGLDELRAIVAHPAMSGVCQQAVWRQLIVNARALSPVWLVGAAGVGLPDLEALAARLAEGVGGDVELLHSAVLAGFIEGLHHVEIGRPGIISRLRWMAYRTALTSRHRRGSCLVPSTDARPCPGMSVEPDVVLFDAVATGAVSPLEAELIARIRIDNLSLTDVAAQLGIAREAARTGLQRGDAALAAAIDDGGRRRSGSAVSSGRADAAGPVREPGGVRGRSTISDGTSEFTRSADLDEEGAFCGPAHHPTTSGEPADPAPPATRTRRARARCARAHGGWSSHQPGEGSS